MILIGSRALAHYGLKRKCIDWDFIGSEKELEELKFVSDFFITKEHSTIFKIGPEIIEFTLSKEIDSGIVVQGPKKYFSHFLFYQVPTIQSLLAIKEATADFLNREKHFEDINWIYKTFPDIKGDEDLYRAKHLEIKTRIKTAKARKFEFFHKYHNIETIEHDKLHDMVSSILDFGVPTYHLFVTEDTKISEEHWNKLPEILKLRRFIEETLVLTLERWYIPQLLKNGVHNPHTKKRFVHMAGVLAEHTIRGLRDENPCMRNWAKDNQERIKLSVNNFADILIKTPFPKWFNETLLRIRLND